MNQMVRLSSILSLTIGLWCLFSGALDNDKVIRADYKAYYDAYHVEGSFVIYDEWSDKTYYYKPECADEEYIPASTFKIPNSLIALELGIVDNENFVIAWDSVVRRPVWDKDQTLRMAYQNSTVWYYQEIARRIGSERMQTWIDSLHYGNRSIEGELDKFWLNGKSRITPHQQIDFLKQVHHETLPVSKHSFELLKSIMIEKDSADVQVRAKTGWGEMDGFDIGWFVGYVTHGERTYYFSNCLKMPSSQVLGNPELESQFKQARRGITFSILKSFALIN